MRTKPKPSATNDYLNDHVEILLQNYRRWLGVDLIAKTEATARALYFAPFAVLSHDTSADPIFNYANKTAQDLFEMPWEQFITVPSRLSAEAPEQTERDRLLKQVTEQGYIDDYAGVRVSSSGRRFHVKNVVVWNLYDEAKNYYGQAAVIRDWTDSGITNTS